MDVFIATVQQIDNDRDRGDKEEGRIRRRKEERKEEKKKDEDKWAGLSQFGYKRKNTTKMLSY